MVIRILDYFFNSANTLKIKHVGINIIQRPLMTALTVRTSGKSENTRLFKGWAILLLFKVMMFFFPNAISTLLHVYYSSLSISKKGSYSHMNHDFLGRYSGQLRLMNGNGSKDTDRDV